MITGDPVRRIITFAIPLMIANIFQMFYTTIDAMVVGRWVGPLALAAVGATTPVIDLLLGLAIGLSNGISIVIAKKIGSNDKRATAKAIINGFYIILIFAVGITMLGLLFNQQLFKITNVSNELLGGATTYAMIIFSGGIFAAIYNYEAAILKAHGNSVIPLLLLILAGILNVGLDLMLVVVFKMGIGGVAIATITAQLFCCTLCFIYIKKEYSILEMNRIDYQINWEYIKEILKVGLPLAFFQSLLAISFLIVQSALNTLGSNEVAAYTAAYKMDAIMIQILAAFGTSMSTFAAQNYGNGSFDRIAKGARDTLKVTLTFSLIVTIIAFFFKQQFMTLFVNSSEISIINLGVNYISFTSCCYFILGINFIVRFVLIGIEQSIVPLVVGILEIFVRCLATLFLIYPHGFTGMIYVNPLCWATSTLLMVLVYPALFKKSIRNKAKCETQVVA